MLFLHYFIFLFLTLKAWAASTMNQSEIRGLAFRPEPTLIFFVASFAFYRREFSSFKTNLSHSVIANSSLVPTLLSIFIPQFNHQICNVLQSYFLKIWLRLGGMKRIKIARRRRFLLFFARKSINNVNNIMPHPLHFVLPGIQS